MTRRLAALTLAAALSLSACGGDDSSSPQRGGGGEETSSSGEQPRTIEGAQASAQEYADRIQSEDYAGAWMLTSQQFQKNIPEDVFVMVNDTCTLSGPKITAKGVRMDGEKAMIRLEVAGVSQSHSMAYEAGEWRMEPSAERKKDFGKKADEIIEERRSSGACAG